MYCVLDPVPSTFYMLTLFILTTPRDEFYYNQPHFADEETETHRY